MKWQAIQGSCLLFCIVVFASIGSTAEPLTIRVAGPTADVRDVPVFVEVDPQFVADPASAGVELRDAATGDTVPGQFVKDDNGGLQLCFVIRHAKANQPSQWQVRLDASVRDDWDAFSWKDMSGRWLNLTRNDRPVARFMYEYDESTEERRFETYKPFLHLYGINGQRLTNGPDGESAYAKEGNPVSASSGNLHWLEQTVL